MSGRHTRAVNEAIVVGLGSIGQRHARLLNEIGLVVKTVSRRLNVGDFHKVDQAVKAHPAALLVIASETAQHIDCLVEAQAAGHLGPTVIEKPLATRLSDLHDIMRISDVWVAYNLRYSPVISALIAAIGQVAEPVIAARLHAGQFLGDWRAGASVEEGYSAHAARGGGVLRDLSHELDLITWLWGRATGVCALGGRRATVTVDSDDCWILLLRTDKQVDAAVSMNYLDRPASRSIYLNTTYSTFSADLIKNTVEYNGHVTTVPAQRDTSYRTMWLDILDAYREGRSPTACTFEEGVELVKLIADCELSAQGPRWLDR